MRLYWFIAVTFCFLALYDMLELHAQGELQDMYLVLYLSTISFVQ